MNDSSSSRGTVDENVAKENGNVSDKELNRAESDVEKANGIENCTLNVYKRKIKENKFEQVQVEQEKVEERSDLGKQPSGGKNDQKHRTRKLEVKDTSGLSKQSSSSKKKKKHKATELQEKDTSDSSKQPGGSKKEGKQKTTETQTNENLPEKNAHRNEVSKDMMDSKEDHKKKSKENEVKDKSTVTKAKTKLPEKITHSNEASNGPIDKKEDHKKKKRKENELTKDEDNTRKKKEKKLEADHKRKRTEMELKKGDEQMDSVSKKIREDNAMVEKLKDKKVKSENVGRKGQNQAGKKKQKLVEPEVDGRKGHMQDGKKKQKEVDNGNNSENEKENGTSEINLYKFPMNRVMKIIKNEEFNGRISQEAIFVINKASEKFLELFAKEAYASTFLDHKTQVSYDHLSSVVCRRKRFDFLSDFVPEKVKAEDALAEMSKDDDDDHETTT